MIQLYEPIRDIPFQTNTPKLGMDSDLEKSYSASKGH